MHQNEYYLGNQGGLAGETAGKEAAYRAGGSMVISWNGTRLKAGLRAELGRGGIQIREHPRKSAVRFVLRAGRPLQSAFEILQVVLTRCWAPSNQEHKRY